jgi:hypothetical protein
LRLPQANLTIYQRGAQYLGIKIFNNLQLEIKIVADDQKSFKRELKKIVMRYVMQFVMQSYLLYHGRIPHSFMNEVLYDRFCYYNGTLN